MTDLDRLLGIKLMGYPEYEPVEDWHPTTDIAQAMICAEKRGELLLDGFFGPKPFWEAVVNSFSAEADTPALAICKAIAKALEGK